MERHARDRQILALLLAAQESIDAALKRLEEHDDSRAADLHAVRSRVRPRDAAR